MIDIILAILPLLVASVVVVAIIFYCNKKYQNVSTEKTDALKGDAKQTNKKRMDGKYVAYGLSIGTCLGMGIGAILSLFGIFSINSLTYGGCFGMLIGLIIGLCFEKPQTSNNVK